MRGQRLGLVIAAIGVVVVGAGLRDRLRGRPAGPGDALDRAVVRRMPMEDVVLVGGEVEGAKQTSIDCELENIGGISGIDATGTGGLTITMIVPNGARVKKGDVLCRFDSSGFEASARDQEIDLEQARAELRQGELDLHSSEVGLNAFRDGEAVALTAESRGKIALSRADLQRARERLDWTRRMRGIGYVPAGQVADEEGTVLTQANALAVAESALRAHLRFTVPKTLRELEGKIEANREKLAFAQLQLKNSEGRLVHLREQVGKCTIRAPHDGMAVHADIVYGDEWALREGSTVYQGQPLFYLPELNRLVAEISLHETIAHRVKPGMTAEVRMIAFPGETLTGKVAFIAQLPEMNWRVGRDLRHFPAQIAIDRPPPRVLPSMSAEVRIRTGKMTTPLVVPAEAVAVEPGGEFCYVDGPAGAERRAVVVERGTPTLLKVVSGLAEGEVVLLRPSRLRDTPSALPGLLGDFPPAEPEPQTDAELFDALFAQRGGSIQGFE